MKMRGYAVGDLGRIDDAIALLRAARDKLRAGGAPIATLAVMGALNSAMGARRHAERRRDAEAARIRSLQHGGAALAQHVCDDDCVMDGQLRADGVCGVCGADGSEPCPDCGGVRYHADGCATAIAGMAGA